MKALSLRFLLITITLSLCQFGLAQDAIDSNRVVQPSAMQLKNTVEEVEGLVDIAEYFGKKIIKEIGNRIGEPPSEKSAPVRKKVIMKLGPLRIERYEDG